MHRTLLSVIAILLLTATQLPAAGPLVLSSGKQPADARLAPRKDYDGFFPFKPSATKEEWNRRAERVRQQILVSQGLYPLPTKTPLNAVVHGKVDRGDYTVERVYFESMPGFFVTGSLYRPVGKQGKHPVVLRPDGHFNDGRFLDAGVAATRREIVQGAERFEEGGRSPLQACCVQLARMGCIVLHYDMIGYADSVQLSFELGHKFAKQRPEMNVATNWGLYSAQAESNLQSIMGLQTWNSIRALDFLETLPDADMTRVGVTGASGGGTQTMLISAVDPRITVAAPAVMVSTAMQGGCTCENASLLRVGTGNVEFAALFAPKPQICLSADDWTKEMPKVGFPELQAHYKLMGAENMVAHKPLLHFGHNYNYVSRAAIYSWFNKHLKLGLQDPIVEEDYKRLTRAELTVWDEKHPKPVSGDDFERKLCQVWRDDSQKQVATLAAKPEQMRNVWSILNDVQPAPNGGKLPRAADISYEQTFKEDRGDYLEMAGLLRDKGLGAELPVAFLYPKEWKGTVVVWLTETGKEGLYGDDGKPNAAVRKLVANGASVMGIDMLHQGEFLKDGMRVTQTELVANQRQFAGYTFGYNRTLLADRVHDVLLAVAYLRQHERQPKRVCLVALDEMSRVAVVARLLAEQDIDRTALDTDGFRFANVHNYRNPYFLPGGAKYGDIVGVLAASSPKELWLAGETADSMKPVTAAYAKQADKLKLSDAKDDKVTAAAVEWLMRP